MSKRVLFVDDEPLVVQALARMLHYDFEVDTALGGLEAIEKLSKNSFDAIVSDMRMPGISGAALLKHTYTNYPWIARLLLTAQCDLDEQTFAISEGHIHGMLYKPCTSSELLNALTDSLLKVGCFLSDFRDSRAAIHRPSCSSHAAIC